MAVRSALSYLFLLITAAAACPADIVLQATQCFSDLASGVTETQQTTFQGSMPLNYHKIREYCQEGGHMTRFLSCVDNLLKQCENKPEAEILLQLINPDRVRTSVPNLCKNVDVVEASATCLNEEMNKKSQCKNRAYEMIKKGMAGTTGNVTAMFIAQCRFFSMLAECQRKAVADNCGEALANLHADFLLSFVPNTCSKEKNYTAKKGSVVSSGAVTTQKTESSSSDLLTILGISPSQKNASVATATPTTRLPGVRTTAKLPADVPSQVLKTLPPITDHDKSSALKNGQITSGSDKKDKFTNGASSIVASTIVTVCCLVHILSTVN